MNPSGAVSKVAAGFADCIGGHPLKKIMEVQYSCHGPGCFGDETWGRVFRNLQEQRVHASVAVGTELEQRRKATLSWGSSDDSERLKMAPSKE
jgi:hypothetical protein